MDAPSSPAPAREHDSTSWWYLIHTKLYRYRALMRKYWWLVLFTTCAGLAIGAWKTAHQQVVYVSTGRMMASGISSVRLKYSNTRSRPSALIAYSPTG